MSICSALIRTKDFNSLFLDTEQELSVVNVRYKGNHQLYNEHLKFNLLITACLTGMGLINCCLIRKYLWWRSQVPIINSIIVCSFIPFFYTYILEEIMTLFIPMHMMHGAIQLLCTDSILQIVISTVALILWDAYYLLSNILEEDGLFQQGKGPFILASLYCVSMVACGRIFQNTRKIMFLQHLRLKSINKEYLDILQYIPEGVMIAQINVDRQNFDQINYSKDK